MAGVEKLVHRFWEKLVLVASVLLAVLAVVVGVAGILHLLGIALPINGRITEGLLVTVVGLSIGYACVTENHTQREITVRSRSDRARYLLKGGSALLGAFIWSLAAWAAAGYHSGSASPASAISHPINRGVWAFLLVLVAIVLLIQCIVSLGKGLRK